MRMDEKQVVLDPDSAERPEPRDETIPEFGSECCLVQPIAASSNPKSERSPTVGTPYFELAEPLRRERFSDLSDRTPNPASARKRVQTPSVKTIRPMPIARIAKTASAMAILSCRTSRKYCLLLSLLSIPLFGVRKKKPDLPLIPCKKPMQIAVVMHDVV
jgi:hypothetical protein